MNDENAVDPYVELLDLCERMRNNRAPEPLELGEPTVIPDVVPYKKLSFMLRVTQDVQFAEKYLRGEVKIPD